MAKILLAYPANVSELDCCYLLVFAMFYRILRGFSKWCFFLVFVSLGVQTAFADDIEAFVQNACDSLPNYRFVFIIDNSGSMSDVEFEQSRNTINASVERVLNSVPEAQVAVVQFGTSDTPPYIHDYNVTVPFTSDKTVASTWQRAYGSGGTVDADYIQDHIPASLAKIRSDGAYSPGGALDITDGDNVQFVLFTDADRDLTRACCSSTVAEDRTYISTDVYPQFGEYDALKNGSVLPGGMKAQFTVLHVSYSEESKQAGVAIASVGGDYNGTIELNVSDPDGSGTMPRRYINGSFTEDDTTQIIDLLDKVIQESYIPLKIESESFSELAVDISRSSSWSSDNRTYLSLFKPSTNRAWIGNLKGYFLGKTGLEDTNGLSATVDTPDGPIFADNAQSFWSATPDGNVTKDGGAAEQLTGGRKLVTNVGSSQVLTASDNALLSSNTKITNTDLGAGSDAERIKAIDWLQTASMGDPLHTKLVLVRYATKTVVYSMTNQGLLHAIDATTPTIKGNHTGGEELWAFMPKELLKNLPLLSASPTPGSHIYGLDGGMTRWHDDTNHDGIVNGTEDAVLIFGMRRGGRSYYALDISSPDSPRFKWQITGGVTAGFEELQQTWSRAALTSLRYGSKKTVLIFGGGYDLSDDTNTARTPGSGNRVYIVDADKGTLLWSVGAGSANHSAGDMNYAIPSDIAVIDTNGNGFTDRLYFGDMGGQVWRVIFKENVDSNNNPTVNFTSSPTVTRVGDFGNTTRLQFFYPPAVALLYARGETNLTISIGSGNRAHPTDTSVQNWMLMIRESFETPSTSTLSLSDLYDATNNLVSQGSDTGSERDKLESADGWKLKLNAGEKSLSTPHIFENKLRFTSFQSGTLDTSASCAVTQSTSRYYVMNLRDATPASDKLVDESELTKEDRSTVVSTMGIPSSPVLTFPPEGSTVDVYVENKLVGSISQNVHQMLWKQIR